MPFYSLYITNREEHFSFKSGWIVQVVKHLKDDYISYSVTVLFLDFIYTAVKKVLSIIC